MCQVWADFCPCRGKSCYGASKAAVKLFTEALYAELLNTNVRVSAIFPGAVATNITANSNVTVAAVKQGKKQKSHKTLSAQKAAEIIVKGIQKEKFKVLVGKDAKFMDFIYRFNPKFAVKLIAKNMKDLIQ
jgi:short-subunit dehydrogenase